MSRPSFHLKQATERLAACIDQPSAARIVRAMRELYRLVISLTAHRLAIPIALSEAITIIEGALAYEDPDHADTAARSLQALQRVRVHDLPPAFDPTEPNTSAQKRTTGRAKP